jgi:hypothetical protein
VKGCPTTCITAGVRISWKLGKKCLMGTTGMNPATGRPYGDDGLSLMGGGNTGMPPSYAVPPTSGNTGNAPHDFENNYVHDKCYGK